MKLRGYQMAATDLVFDRLGTHASTLLVLPTGCGKTVIFSEVAARWPDFAALNRWPSPRVLVLAHREELIRQAAEKLHAASGEAVGVEMAGESARDHHRLVVASVQTLAKARRRSRWTSDSFGLIVTDEAHHSPAASYGDIYAHFAPDGSPTRHLGVTATPKRADELALGQVYASVAMEYGIVDAVDDGYLVPVRQRVVTVAGLDFADARTLVGDFNEGDLDRILREESVLHKVAAPTVELCGDRPALVFCVTVAHAEAMAAVLDRYKPGSAHALSGGSSREVRVGSVREFRSGKRQYLCSCNLFLEGFDAPACAAVVMARPTKSLALYTQALGRGTRTLPGVIDGLSPDNPAARRAAIAASPKPDLLVLDFAGNAGRHRIVTAADVLGGKYGLPVREYATKTLQEEGEAVPTAYALERAAAELALLDEERLRREELARRREIVARAMYATESVDPFDRAGAAHGATANGKSRGRPATPKQVNYLVHLGVSRAEAASYSLPQAGAVIDSILAKRGKAGVR